MEEPSLVLLGKSLRLNPDRGDTEAPSSARSASEAGFD